MVSAAGARCLAAAAATLAAVTAAAQTAPPAKAAPEVRETVEVVGVTPIHGLGVPRDLVPVNVQVLRFPDPRRMPGGDLSVHLTAALGSVHVNEAQSNPFQPDLQFRGFVASPLLGLPQGLAVYQDGVRINEVFGDTVNWDVLPSNAIAGVNLIPGSNPLFGLNALGGALSIQTKSGFSHAGHGGRVFAGSFGRRWVEAESGGAGGRLAYFVGGRALEEDGWRDFSPSRVRQLFGDVSWRGERSSLSLSVTAGSNRLIGNGPAPAQLLDERRAAIFTHPDETRTDVALLSARGRRSAGRLTLDAVAYYRPATIRTFNGDDTTYDECEDDGLDGLLCADEGEGRPVRDQSGRLVAADEDDELDATNNTSRTRTHGWGGGLQLTAVRPLAGRNNQFLAGVQIDGGPSRYAADTALARLTATRGTAGTGLLDAGASVRLRTSVRHVGVHAADFFTLTPRLTLTASARLTRSAVDLEDTLGAALDGEHRFSRFDPAVGATLRLSPALTAYGSLSHASRVPAPSELSCADPDDPCRLPNAFVADPPLAAVRGRTLEGGVRGRANGVTWAASAFRTVNSDDIVFISSGALTNQGYFANVGDTTRHGVELQAAGAAAGRLEWAASYTWLRARFATPLTISSPNHPDAVGGEIRVDQGRNLPGIPRHNVKAAIAATAGRVTIGGAIRYTSSQFLRGDEANLLPPIAAAAVVDVSGRVSLHPRLSLAVRVSNLFDQEYATFGLLGEPDEVLGDDFDDPRFLGPGARPGQE